MGDIGGEKDRKSLLKLVSLPAGRQGISFFDDGDSIFYSQTSCFDTSIVTVKRYFDPYFHARVL
jgi:hypothetical protein